MVVWCKKKITINKCLIFSIYQTVLTATVTIICTGHMHTYLSSYLFDDTYPRENKAELGLKRRENRGLGISCKDFKEKIYLFKEVF